MNRLVIGALAPLLSACVGYTMIEPQRTRVGGAFSVEPQIAWNKLQGGGGPAEVWTADGQTLQAIYFFAGIAEGGKLYSEPPNVTLPAFRSGMTAPEVAELVEASVSRIAEGAATSRGLRPARFGGLPGFRFEMTILSKDEIEREAAVVGAIKDGKLMLIMMVGAQVHYFPKYLPYFDKLVESALLI